MARRVCAAVLAAVLLLTARLSVPDEGAVSNAGKALQAALASRLEACPGSRLEHHELARYYPVAAPMPVWVDDNGPLPPARRLRAALEQAEDEGLSPDRYELRGIEARWQATVPAEQACLELLLTSAFARWGRDLAMGQLAPREADPTWHLRGPDFDPVAAVRAMPSEGDVTSQLERLVPSHGLYRRLRTALAHYRRLAAQGGWDTTLAGPRLGRGDEGERVAALRSRLHREGDLQPDASALDRQYDEVLADAVRRFQRRHGLRVDGIAGPRTLAALDTPVAERVAQLRRAMERLRWLPRALGDHYVLVNTAGFELAVVEGERTLLGMRAVVGTPDQATPSFTAMLRSLVINPYWNVPARIARDKLLPRERRNPGYLAAHGFRVLDPRTGQWRAPDATSLAEVQAGDRKSTPRLRQEPGPANLMGRLSFILPNAFDIFLHDTPDRSLFAHEVRASSEGCVRIERAMALALHTLRRVPEWTEDRIQGEVDALRHRVLALPEPIPVYVVYLPSWVDEEGLAHFRPDHYGRERVLARHFPPETVSARIAHRRVLGANGGGMGPALVLDGFIRRAGDASRSECSGARRGDWLGGRARGARASAALLPQ